MAPSSTVGLFYICIRMDTSLYAENNNMLTSQAKGKISDRFFVTSLVMVFN
jgi:hypothetical protein